MNRSMLAACAMLLCPLQTSGDPLAGRWELNVARTHYGGGAEPRKSETFVCTAAAARITCRIESVMSRGSIVRGDFSAAYDGVPGPTHGMPEFDHVVLKKVNDNIADATFTRDGKPAYAYRTVRSDDGRSLTIIAVDPATRAALNSVVVYDLKR